MSPTLPPCGYVQINANHKEYILNALDEKEVFAKYLGISISDISYCLAGSNNRISNPLRSDNNPSLTFKQYTTKIIMIDYANNYYRGDIFEIVGKIIGKDCRQSKDFIDICNHIIDTFNITYSHIHITKNITTSIKKEVSIDINFKDLTMYDKNLFLKYGLKYKTTQDNIKVVDEYYINGERIDYRYTQRDPCYVYRVNPNKVKLYFPNRPKSQIKFITNNKCPIENLDLIINTNHLIITKSIKDKLLIDQMIEELNIKDIQVITLSSESINLEDDLMNFIKTKTDHIYIMFDNDRTGLEGTHYYVTNYGCIPIYFNIIFPNTKDPSDAVKAYKYPSVVQHFKHIAIELKWL